LKQAVGGRRLQELGRAFSKRREEELHGTRHPAGKKPAGKRASGTASEEAQLLEKSKAELYADARQAGVKGRSRMNKEELAHAIQERSKRY
jgi:Rho termination factor, N-terminal domain